MIAAIGLAFSKFGSWVANNPAVQWALGVLAVIVGLILWGERREGQGRKQEKIKTKERDLVLRERATEAAQEIIGQEETNADEAIDAGELAVRSEPNALERMSDEEWRLTFGRDRAPGDPGYRRKG
jgi:hypothetical protein